MQNTTTTQRVLALFLSLITPYFLQPHGFNADTIVIVDTGFHDLKQLCIEINSDRQVHTVESYDSAQKSRLMRSIVSVAQSDIECFVTLNVGPHNTRIHCSPAQAFFSETEQSWKPACELQTGDKLLTLDNTTCEVYEVKFVHSPLHVYILEVEDPHLFAVTPQKIITHNIFIPEVVVSLSIPWGAGTGGAFGGFFGPATCVIGIAVGGLVGFLWQKCSQNVPHCQINLDIKRLAERFRRRMAHADVQAEPGNQVVVMNETEAATTVEELLKAAQPGRETQGKTKQYIKPGDYQTALEDFKSLNPENLEHKGDTLVGTLNDGRKMNVREKSTAKQPTLEIQGKRTIKIRYE